jgi:hypothetical protein
MGSIPMLRSIVREGEMFIKPKYTSLAWNFVDLVVVIVRILTFNYISPEWGMLVRIWDLQRGLKKRKNKKRV